MSDFVDVDLDWFDDMDPFAGELTDPVAILKQDVYHMLIESPGSNLDDPDRGIGLEERLSSVANLRALESHIDAELQKDPRIDVAHTTIAAVGDGSYTVSILIEYDGEELGLDFTKDDNGVRQGVG